LLESGCDALIFRVSWVYGLRGTNFLLTMQRLMDERDELRIVDDQIGAPTWSRTIAQATALALARMSEDRNARRLLCGLYHLAPTGGTSWFGFATAIRDILGLDCALHPIPTSQYPTPARRPMNSRMDTRHFRESFRLVLPQWQSDLALCAATRTDSA
jgi:dTDP-4-dehydrorhamnose reductase